MIRINSLKVPGGSSLCHVRAKAARILKIKEEAIKDMVILKRSRDARDRGNILDVYSVALGMDDEHIVLSKCHDRNVSVYRVRSYCPPAHGSKAAVHRPVIAGFGPSGMFAAYLLSMEGYRPIVFERGSSMDKRTEDVKRFWETGKLDPSSNVQFGEGGAGTFSDGKLNSGIKDREGRRGFVMDTFIKYGAPESIRYDNHPHIGTDVLRALIPRMREDMIEMGADIRFDSPVTDVIIQDGRLSGITVKGSLVECDTLFLCPGHSARDTFRMLCDRGVSLEAKPYAVGVRAEHKRSMIDEALGTEHASYKLTYHCSDGRGVYSFCMCPGGYVINASSEEGGLTVNGMSYSGRDGENSNAAIVCTVSDEDFEGFGTDPLRGMRFQMDLEEKACREGGGAIPYQRFGDFKNGRISESFGSILPGCKGRYASGDIRRILPPHICDDIIEAMSGFGQTIKGFDADDTLFAGIEGRTSSPVRITRNDDMVSVSTRGLYPVGEGAGYAGGIMSSAIDGIKAAEEYIKEYTEKT